MIWTALKTVISVTSGTRDRPVYSRAEDTVWIDITKDEAIGLIAEITRAFGVESVPSEATFDEVRIVIANPQGFLAREVE